MTGFYLKRKTRMKLIKDQFLKTSQDSRNPSEKSTEALDLHVHILAWIKNGIGHLTTLFRKLIYERIEKVYLNFLPLYFKN